MKSKLYIFRHTESLDNQHSRFSGGRNIGLSQKGYQDAEELAEKLKTKTIDIAYTSDLIRTLDTMAIVLKYHPEVIKCIDRRIRERSYGWLEGQNKKTWAKYAYPIFKIFHRSYRIPPPGGESLATVQMRVNNFLSELVCYLELHPMNVAICVHSGSIRSFREYFEKDLNRKFNEIETKPGELFEYEIESLPQSAITNGK